MRTVRFYTLCNDEDLLACVQVDLDRIQAQLEHMLTGEALSSAFSAAPVIFFRLNTMGELAWPVLDELEEGDFCPIKADEELFPEKYRIEKGCLEPDDPVLVLYRNGTFYIEASDEEETTHSVHLPGLQKAWSLKAWA